ncbi:HlyD family efflux transporter periplasmic adaptor subunit [Endozoicomonas sp. SM1973]|uniref:HlyD family efflux transporter periplasmic adaptor subunit n=1 Tax=Spartinivicinus marinus TaxID=2994442 RepID=A0A853I225_9GAMM|nr:HlyD family efflux transporter periplasmic adaptor subunit [Spartinivicinus marinus]MCX4028434.1 HlyD family efflux transporter periplasmic adaptor subunit [Spartinivicinus marinus]NYZ67453.1 HlyD family efflux transporter periplasmic adaptor subunit [Spartinivicinus marinus]
MNDINTGIKQPSAKYITNLTRLIQLENQVRQTTSIKALQFLAVNHTRQLLRYDQAFLVFHHRYQWQLVSIANTTVIDSHSPLACIVKAVTQTHSTFFKQPAFNPNIQQLFKNTDNSYRKLIMPHILYHPIRLPTGKLIGGLWLGRTQKKWQPTEQTLLRHLSTIYGHGFQALGVKEKRLIKLTPKRYIVCCIALILLFCFPVSLTITAPAEIVARAPTIVSAPINGVIKQLWVKPNQTVASQQKLFSFETTTLANQYAISQQQLNLAYTRYHQALQISLKKSLVESNIGLYQAEAKLRLAESQFTQAQLAQAEVIATQSGIVQFSSVSDWQGRPVVTGEQVMTISDPQDVIVNIYVPVKNHTVLPDNAQIKLFLDAVPLQPLQATLQQVSFAATPHPAAGLSYQLSASLNNQPKIAQIGLKGTAKVYSESVSLFYYLFRRPITAIRQFLGI